PAPVSTAGLPRVRGIVTLNVETKNLNDVSRIAVMTVYVDGHVQAIMNVAPFRHELDTRRLPNGRHEVELRALDGQGGVVAERKTAILVDNPVDGQAG
ncbi:MAG TPA: TcfC E-set like domain-containing protein, partial [Armatimonadota bacterium]|nr:TcfC E-set like domain-containing protein [Armatimonadota bacterium]